MERQEENSSGELRDSNRNAEIHHDFNENHDNCTDDIPKRVFKLLQQAKSLQTSGSVLSSRLRIEEHSLSQQAISLEQDLKRARSDINASLMAGEISIQLAEKLEEEIEKAHWMMCDGDIAALLPHKYNGAFLRLFLGTVNVKAAGNDVRFKVKEEYNAYRDRTATLFLFFPLILLLLKNWLWEGCFPALPVQAYQAWLLFFYTSLALRENILRINGSDIRPWWVYHHYCAMLMAVVSLTWDFKGQHPHCEEKQHGVYLFLIWAVMQGVVMLLQNRYQRQRLYTRIALGKVDCFVPSLVFLDIFWRYVGLIIFLSTSMLGSSVKRNPCSSVNTDFGMMYVMVQAGRMDVVWGETAGMEGQILLLYPLLFALQFFQGFLGFLLLRTAFTKKSEWQVTGCGVLLLVMAVGNFANTLQTLSAKVRIKNRMKGKNLLQNRP